MNQLAWTVSADVIIYEVFEQICAQRWADLNCAFNEITEHVTVSFYSCCFFFFFLKTCYTKTGGTAVNSDELVPLGASVLSYWSCPVAAGYEGVRLGQQIYCTHWINSRHLRLRDAVTTRITYFVSALQRWISTWFSPCVQKSFQKLLNVTIMQVSWFCNGCLWDCSGHFQAKVMQGETLVTTSRWSVELYLS